jgi:predicted kinase
MAKILSLGNFVFSTVLRDLIESIIEEGKTAIPEIEELKGRVGIFLLGPPASGKSTFVNHYILPRNNTFKIINPDDISVIRKHWTDAQELENNDMVDKSTGWIKDSKKLHYLEAVQAIKKGRNFILDTTGNDINGIMNYINLASQNDYKIIMIHIMAPIEQAERALKWRNENGDQPKVESGYFFTTHKGSTNLVQQYLNKLKEIHSDYWYYLVTVAHVPEEQQQKGKPKSWLGFFKLTPGTNKVQILNSKGEYEMSGFNIYSLYNKLNKDPHDVTFQKKCVT